MVVAMGPKGEIGLNNKLPWNIREDLEHFKKTTINQVVIMGGNTYRSLPFSKLPNRINIVLSTQKYESKDKSLIFVSSKEECLEILEKFPNLKHFVIGGSHIYNLFSPNITEWIITEINQEFFGDVFYQNSWNSLKEFSRQKLTENADIVTYRG